LIEFQTLPDREPRTDDPPALDWQKIFAGAGLAEMQETTEPLASWAPPLFVEQRLAWRGKYSEVPETPVHAEAGLRAGRVVFFHTAPARDLTKGMSLFAESSQFSGRKGWSRVVFGVILLTFLLVGLALAWHNVRLGRANLRGTILLGSCCFIGLMVQWLSSAHNVPDVFDTLELLQAELGHIAWVTAQF